MSPAGGPEPELVSASNLRPGDKVPLDDLIAEVVAEPLPSYFWNGVAYVKGWDIQCVSGTMRLVLRRAEGEQVPRLPG